MPPLSEREKLSIVPYDPRFRPIAPPPVGIFDSPTISVCINERWAGHVEGVLDRLMWLDAWAGTSDDQEFAIAEIGKLIIQLMNRNPCGTGQETMFRLRQNPSNKCQLQQSVDGGATWSLAFDFSLCRPKPSLAEQITVNEYTNNQLTNITNIYQNEGIAGLAPDTIYDGTNEDALRDKLLCWACRETVKLVCEAVLEARRQQALGLNLASVSMGLVVTLSTFVSMGALTPIIAGIVATVTASLATLWDGVSSAILENEQTRERVACCMYASLSGDTPTRARFANSLSGCDFGFGSDEAQLAGAIASGLDTDEMHAGFLDLMQDNWRRAELGLIDDCPCEGQPDDCYDFTLSSWGWEILAPNYGSWDSTGWRKGKLTGSSAAAGDRIGIQLNKNGQSITKVTVQFNQVWNGKVRLSNYPYNTNVTKLEVQSSSNTVVFGPFDPWDSGIAVNVFSAVSGSVIPDTLRLVSICIEYA